MKKFVTLLAIIIVLGLLNIWLAFNVEDMITHNQQTGHLMVVLGVIFSLILLGLLKLAYKGNESDKSKVIPCLVSSLFPLTALFYTA